MMIGTSIHVICTYLYHFMHVYMFIYAYVNKPMILPVTDCSTSPAHRRRSPALKTSCGRELQSSSGALLMVSRGVVLFPAVVGWLLDVVSDYVYHGCWSMVTLVTVAR